ncbi:uncharacterized protein LOC132715913 [Ruditapes philippinarum]|uniref:uncharacterized protein LOC132715913 n=1 Tax=Ruditapes philippinarum TaxID=129788 RepID=UPI00295BA649|nr:uncharacterized protein LOC132715913 [Ruditapes philippinarum]
MALLVSVGFLSLFISTEASFKKGTAAWPGSLLCDDFKVLNNMSWWYDWHQNMDFFYEKVGKVCDHSNGWSIPQHVPMLKQYHNHTQLHIQTWGPYVLGFNEPNHKDQANMTPQQAADAWPLLEKNSHGAKLVSPATAGAKIGWYDSFFSLCHGCRVDYIAAHMYNCDANAIMSYLQRLYDRYHKQIWLTEFACPHSSDENQQLNLMKNLLPQLEAAPFVYRYLT